MIDFIEEETILINDPVFSREVLADYHIRLERPARQKRMENYAIKAEDERDKKDVKRSSEDNSSRCKMCNGRHDLDECKAFNEMIVEERSKFLSKQKLCYSCYEAITLKLTARNFPTKRNCKICLEKHPTSLHGYKIRKKEDSKSDDDPGKTAKNNFVNIKDAQCESIGTGEMLSMCSACQCLRLEF